MLIQQLIENRMYVKELIGNVATKALIAEVSTTPKPGLVDCISNGAHKDMDYQMFLDSAWAISIYFKKMAETGFLWDATLPELFQEIRKVGLQAEKAMFQATHGVNTHKGLIFSAGIVSAASAYVYRKMGRFHVPAIFQVCSAMTYDVLNKDFERIDSRNPKTNGERLYTLYGIKGIRGEVQNGFPSIQYLALPSMNKFVERNKNQNESNLQVLFLLMAHVNDTNVLSRHNYETLNFVKETAKKVLALGGAFTKTGRKAILELDAIFVQKNISSGGCADLLAITIMINSLSRL